ncbi:hypothetical protein [Nostoc sp. UHCC 0251]|uniref:hypothetical protein n=1 Tax=Nostoc sp. UHCC 0251 TaxID=3110240 RepID=UPI002B215B2F|nr:hypothetical protein [Nostoc sp. UHCC 0251]MEA5627125.1 hypothetical protein [Nostoc sp. UHCC 0251]
MATFTVITLNNVVSSTDGLLSLREAVTAAEALPGTDTIAINGSVLLNSPIVIRQGNSINFQGNGTSSSGFNGQGRTSLFLINNSTVTFNNLHRSPH